MWRECATGSRNEDVLTRNDVGALVLFGIPPSTFFVALAGVGTLSSDRSCGTRRPSTRSAAR